MKNTEKLPAWFQAISQIFQDRAAEHLASQDSQVGDLEMPKRFITIRMVETTLV
jgi:hypothetical protein